MLLNSEHVRRDVDTLRLRRSSVTWRRTRWRRYMNHHHHQPPSSLRTSPGKRAPSIQTIQAKKIAFSSFSLFSLSKKDIGEGWSFCPMGPWPRRKTGCPTPIPDICHERHERRSCKFFLAGVNAKNWHFRQILREKVAFFTDLTQKIGIFRCKFYSPKILPV